MHAIEQEQEQEQERLSLFARHTWWNAVRRLRRLPDEEHLVGPAAAHAAIEEPGRRRDASAVPAKVGHRLARARIPDLPPAQGEQWRQVRHSVSLHLRHRSHRKKGCTQQSSHATVQNRAYLTGRVGRPGYQHGSRSAAE